MVHLVECNTEASGFLSGRAPQRALLTEGERREIGNHGGILTAATWWRRFVLNGFVLSVNCCAIRPLTFMQIFT